MTKATHTERDAGAKIDRRVLRSRSVVLAAGRDLYHERGAAGITVEEITRRTGVAKTTIYRHWRSREELVIEILADTAVELPVVRTDDAISDIRTALMAMWASLVEPTRRSGLAATIQALTTDPELAALHREFLTARGAPLVDAVERALDSGLVRVDLPTQTAADLLVSPIIVRAFIRADQPDRRYVDHLVRAVLGT